MVQNDTASILNKMWLDTAQSNNTNLKQNNKNIQVDSNCSQPRNETYVVNSEFGQFKSNRRYDPVYASSSIIYGSTSAYDITYNNMGGKWIKVHTFYYYYYF